MRLHDPWGISAGTLGVIIANILLISVRAFASHSGLEVRWLSRSFAHEREQLRKLASSTDDGIARKARRYLRVEKLGWAVFVVSVFLFFWGVMTR